MAQIPGPSTSSDTLRLCAWYHHAALGTDPGTRGLQAPFAAALEAWSSAELAVVNAAKAAVLPRVAVRFAETGLEVAIDNLFRDAGKAGNEAALAALFPDGKDPEIRPRGASQHARTANVLLPRLRALAVGPLRDTHLAAVEAAVTALKTALDARVAAQGALGQANAAEDLTRDDLVAAFRSNLGAITTLYPRSAGLRDRFFYEFRDSSGSEGNEPTPAPAS